MPGGRRNGRDPPRPEGEEHPVVGRINEPTNTSAPPTHFRKVEGTAEFLPRHAQSREPSVERIKRDVPFAPLGRADIIPVDPSSEAEALLR